MPGKRSNCPMAHALDIVGDRWTLLLIRDMGIFGKTSFGEFSTSPENIPPSTLTARLELMVREQLITKRAVVGGPGRQYRYELTERGTDLLPLLAQMTRWSARHDPETVVSPKMRKQLDEDFDNVLNTLRPPSA